MISVRPNQIAAVLFLGCLGTSAYFFARGTTSYLAPKLFGFDPPPRAAAGASRPGGAGSAAPQRPSVDVSAIANRHVFAPPPAAADAGVGAESAAAPVNVDWRTQNVAACTGEVRVLGAMIHPSDASWSYAALATGQAAAMLYRPGQTVGARTVLGIDTLPADDVPAPLVRGPHRVRVVLQEGATICQLGMFSTGAVLGAGTAATAAGAAPAGEGVPAVAQVGEAAAAPTAPGEIPQTELDQGITRASDTSFTVNRALMERVLAQQDSLFRSARLIPNEANGTVSGMKVYGIRRSSVLGRLGVMNGDVLQNVNGQSMNTADALMQAYSSLGRNGNFAISILRRGQPMTLNYTVQ